MALIFLIFWQKENISVIHRGVSREDAFKLSEPVPLDVFKPKKHRLANGLYGGWTACLIFVISLLFFLQKKSSIFHFFHMHRNVMQEILTTILYHQNVTIFIKTFLPTDISFSNVIISTTTPWLTSLG